jgi:chaperonin cofactor prefoldin
MVEESLERIERHMVQLIQMVAENNKTVASLEQRFDGLEHRFDGLEHRFDGLEQRFDGLEQRFDDEKELNRLRHKELLKEVRNINFEIDYLRNQSAKHDMEIHVLKQN